MIDGFVIPANSGSPDSIERKRRMAQAMMQQSANNEPIQHWSQGVNKMAQALMGGLAMRKADREESEGRKSANDALLRALSGGKGVSQGDDPQGALVEAMNNPFMSPQGSAMALDMWKRQNTPPDPMADLERQYKEAQIAKMKADMETAQNGGNTEYGLNPQFGVDAQGNPVMIQVGKNGQAVQTQMPPDVQLSREPIKLDAGTHFVLLDPITRQPVGQIPKDLAGAEAQKEIGTAQGKAQAAAGSDVTAADEALALLDSIETDPNIDRGTGFSSYGNAIRGTSGYDFQNKVDQAKSGAFLSAIQQMRGMGALSNAEGQTATAAVNRMNTATSKEEFLDALGDYRNLIMIGKQKAMRLMGTEPPAIQPPAIQQNSEGWTTLPNGVKIKQVQ